MKTIFKHMFRRGQTGQTLVIMAFGFIVLLGFVGIVTDVSLLFVRYSTLRRAVDSAAVAAAGQLRRALPTQVELAEATAKGLDPDGIAYARNLATINLAARQFIEFYGLSPENVLVETCQSTDYSDVELCTADQRKLVRVTAQVASPTVFLRLLGWGTVVLEASAISESAILEVVLIMDVSESMLDTTRPDWCPDDHINADGSCDTDFQTARIIPPRMDVAAENWRQANISATNPDPDPADFEKLMLNTFHPDVLANPFIQSQMKAYIMNGSTPQEVPLTHDSVPRPTCQVRYYPDRYDIPNQLREDGELYGEGNLLAEFQQLVPGYPAAYGNFIPLYNYYGCCNDPNGDGNFDDLVCQPFKQARDASLKFIEQVDFARGDRVAIVTFDRGATLMKPLDGTGETSMLETQAQAEAVLKTSVGVRAEGSFYSDDDDDGYWDRYVINGVATEPIVVGEEPGSKYNQYWDTRPIGLLTEVPSKQNCPYLMAYVNGYRSLYSATDQDVNPNRYPNALASIMIPNFTSPGWSTRWVIEGYGAGDGPKYSYELRASCAGTNMGGALREANNALATEGRINGSVWVMVMLSDGGAGASDPMLSDTAGPLQLPDPYKDVATSTNPAPNGVPPLPGEYGVFGVCPTGTWDNPSELILDKDRDFPYCGDLRPETRNFCFQYDDKDNPYLFKSVCGETSDYDVDDFAREWADYVGLEFRDPDAAASVSAAAALKPTIFTIGFNLRFDDATTRCKEGQYDTTHDVENCLGEELLRYIADVGDNFRIDTDYQQDWRSDEHAIDLNLADGDNWGGRGPCEDPMVAFGDPEDIAGDTNINTEAKRLDALLNPKPAGENCGNYFNATDGLALERVFDEIAARMFTRLSR